MITYSSTVQGLLEDVDNDRLVEEIDSSFKRQGIGAVSPKERQSWRNSFKDVFIALSRSKVPREAGVAIEFRIPLTSKRVDLIISGHDREGEAHIFIIELKQWEGEGIHPIEGKDGVVETDFQGKHERTHPSYQAWSYANFLEDFNTEIRETPIHLHPIAYLHNFDPDQRDKLEKHGYQEYANRAPLFLKGQVSQLRAELEQHLQHGDNGEIIEKVDESSLKPGKSLQNAVLDMLEGNEEFTLIDDQKTVHERVLHEAKEAVRIDVTNISQVCQEIGGVKNKHN